MSKRDTERKQRKKDNEREIETQRGIIQRKRREEEREPEDREREGGREIGRDGETENPQKGTQRRNLDKERMWRKVEKSVFRERKNHVEEI